MTAMLDGLLRAFDAAGDKQWFARSAFALRLLARPRWDGIQDELDAMRPHTGDPSPDKRTLRAWADL